MRSIKKIRKIFGMSQEQLAVYLGITRSLMALVEQGRRNLPTNALLKLATLEQGLHSNQPYKAESFQKQTARDVAQINAHAKKCLHRAGLEKEKLKKMQENYQECLLALMALGHLQHNNPGKKDALLLELLETKTLKKITRYGYAAQVVLQLRISGLEHEAVQAGKLNF